MHTKENNSMNDGRIRVDVDKAWSKLKGRLQNDGLIPERSPSRTIAFMPVFRVAAAVVLIVGLALVSYLVFSPSENDMRLSFQSDRFESTRLSLPDGSSVDLNSNSKIQFRENESGFRSVKLSGEAYFDVSHDPEKPFIINVGQAVIRVTGTAFSVRSFPSGRRIEVYVKSGSVQFYQAGKEEAKIDLQKFLDDAVLKNVDVVSIIHGTGTGALRGMVQETLKNCSFVDHFDYAVPEQGGFGCTIVKFKN